MFIRHDISSLSRDFRDNHLIVLYAGYEKLSMDGEELLLAPALYFINCLETSPDKGKCC